MLADKQFVANSQQNYELGNLKKAVAESALSGANRFIISGFDNRSGRTDNQSCDYRRSTGLGRSVGHNITTT
jgi:hypothetical protein